MNGLSIKTFAKWTLTAITVILVGNAGVLGYVAIETGRDVQFWPPQIGAEPAPAPIINMGDLKSDLSEIKAILDKELVLLNTRVADARTNMAAGSRVAGQDNYEWRQNVRSYEKDIYNIQDEFISRVNKLENRLESLEKSCSDAGIIRE